MTSRTTSPLTREKLVAGERARRVPRANRARPPALGRSASSESTRARSDVLPSTWWPSRSTRVERVLLAQPRGFCAGVEMAIKALAWMVRVFEPPVYCYHEIVHNRLVVDRFRGSGVVFVDDVDEVPAGAPLMLSAHGSAPEVVAAARDHGPVRRQRGVPAGHQGPPRGEGARRQGLHDPLRRPRRPRRSVGHARGRARRDASGRARRRPRRVLPTVHDPSTGRAARADDARAARLGGHRRPCPRPSSPTSGPRRATTSASPPRTARRRCRAIADARRRHRRDRQRQLVEHDRAGQGRARRRMHRRAARRRPRRARRRGRSARLASSA